MPPKKTNNSTNDIKRALMAKDSTPPFNFNNLTMEQQSIYMAEQLALEQKASSSAKGGKQNGQLYKQQQQQQQLKAVPMTEAEKAVRAAYLTHQLYDLELKEDSNHQCQTFLEHCSSESAKIELSEEEISALKAQLNTVLLPPSGEEFKKADLKSLISSKIQENSQVRKMFALDLQEFKTVLNAKKDLIRKLLALEKDFEIQKNAYKEVWTYQTQIVEKITAVEKNKSELYAEELAKANKIKDFVADATVQTEAASAEYSEAIALLNTEIDKLKQDDEEVERYCSMQRELFPRQRDFKRTELAIVDIKKAQRAEVLSRKLAILKEKSMNCSEMQLRAKEMRVQEGRFQSQILEFEKALKTTEKYTLLTNKQELDSNKALETITKDREYAETEIASKVAEISTQEKDILQLKDALVSVKETTKGKEILLRELQQQRKELKGKVEELSKYCSIAFNNSNMDEI